jgi:hypothetical protein
MEGGENEELAFNEYKFQFGKMKSVWMAGVQQ